MQFAYPNFTNRFCSNRKLQCSLPVGGWLQANAIRCASASPIHVHILDQIFFGAKLLQARTEQRFYALSLSSLLKHQRHLRFGHNSNLPSYQTSAEFVHANLPLMIFTRRNYLFKVLFLLFVQFYFVFRVHRFASASANYQLRQTFWQAKSSSLTVY